MATHGSADVAFLLVGGYSLLADTSELRDKTTAALDDVTPLGAAWQVPAAIGVSRAELAQSGYFNDAALAGHVALNEQQGQSRVLCYALDGNTVGKRFTGYQGALEIHYERLAGLDKLHRVNATYQGNGQVDIGVILAALGAYTGDATGTAVDNGASSAGGGVAYLQVTAFSGFSGVVVKVQHSADNSSWTDLVTFTTVASAPTAERSTVGTTVSRYLRVLIDVTGSGSITLMVGFKRNA